MRNFTILILLAISLCSCTGYKVFHVKDYQVQLYKIDTIYRYNINYLDLYWVETERNNISFSERVNLDSNAIYYFLGRTKTISLAIVK